jgi:hypothetical protein
MVLDQPARALISGQVDPVKTANGFLRKHLLVARDH